MSTTFARIALCALLAMSAGACSQGFQIQTPDGFAELDDKEAYPYRATTAEGVVVAVRREPNDPRGSLKFWMQAIDHDLHRRGYSQLEKLTVKTPQGLQGTQARYRVTHDGRPAVFWMTVFVTETHVIVVEAGGDEAYFKNVEREVGRAIRSLEVG